MNPTPTQPPAAVPEALRSQPCPFCGSTRIGTHMRKHARTKGYVSMCLACRVSQTGVAYGSIERSVAVWNQRAALSAAAPAVAPYAWVPPEREGQYHPRQTIEACREPLAGWVPVYLGAPQAEQPGAAVPDGWKLVPVEPTPEMIRATDRVNFENEDTDGTLHNVWHAMLAAAPAAPMSAQPSEAEAILSKICDLFHIGRLARDEATILTNVTNVFRFAGMLHAVERDLFQPELPEDNEPDAERPAPNCWRAKDEADYVAQFRAAITARLAAPAPTTEQAGGQIVAWRVKTQHGEGGWIDGAPTDEMRNDLLCNAPGITLEYAYAAPGGEAPAEDARLVRALHGAVSAIYFDDSSKFRGALGSVVYAIDPALAGELLSHPKAAFDKSAAREAAQGQEGAA